MNPQKRWLALAITLLCAPFATAQPPEKPILPAPPESASEPQVEPRADTKQEVTPQQRSKDAFGPPPGTIALGKTNNLWIDKKRKRVYLDGYVSLRRGALEMFACPTGTKEHESAIATLSKSIDVHTALLAVGASTGTPVQHLPRFVPATGQVIRVWVCWRDTKGKFQVIDARSLVRRMGTEKEVLKAEWVFAGSGFWTDPSDGKEYYEANSGDLICVSNFATATMDVSIASSADAGQLLYEPFTERLPELGTPVRLVLVPIPPPSDKPVPHADDAKKKPTEKVLPKPKKK